MLLDGINKQGAVSDRMPLPVDVVGDTAYVNSITGETVQLYYFANAYLTCATAGSTTASEWAALTDTATFEIDIYGKTWLIEPDFTGDASMANVAASIQTAIRTHSELSAVTCAYSTNHLVITAVKRETYSADMGNSISALRNPGTNTGVNISGASWMNGAYGAGVVTPATLTTDAGEAAGTVVVAKLAYSGILDPLGAMIGNSKDTSLSWTTGTVLPKKYLKPCPKYHVESTANPELVDIAYAVCKTFTTSGEWCLEHRTGFIIGRKATTGTNDTAAYKVQTQTSGGGTTITESVNVAKIAGTATDVNSGNKSAGSQRVVIATDDVNLSAINTSTGKIPSKGTAAMTGSTPVTLATNDTQFGTVGATADADGNVHGQLRYIGEAVDGLPAALGTAAMAASMPVTIASNDTLTTAVKTAVEKMDDWDATHDSAVVADGAQVMMEAKTFDGSALPNNVAEGDAIRPAVTPYGVKYAFLTNDDGSWSPLDATGQTIKTTEQSPINQQHLSETLVNTTNVATGTYYPSSSGLDMAGYNDLSATGTLIDGAAETTTLSWQVSNVGGTTATDWHTVYAYDTINDTNVNSVAATNETKYFALSADAIGSFAYVRFLITTTAATNTVALHIKRKAL